MIAAKCERMSKTSSKVAYISSVLNPPSVKSGTFACMAEAGYSGTWTLSFFTFPYSSSLSAAHKRLRPVCDVAEECSQNELITDACLWVMAPSNIPPALKNSNSWLFQVCFSHWKTLGHPLLVFLETWIITRPPLPFSFIFFIESLFNLVRKIGLAWERQNSLGIGSVVLELCALFCCCFFPCRKKKFQFVPKPHEIQIKRSWVRRRPQHHDKDMGCLSKELYKWRSPGEKEGGLNIREEGSARGGGRKRGETNVWVLGGR